MSGRRNDLRDATTEAQVARAEAAPQPMAAFTDQLLHSAPDGVVTIEATFEGLFDAAPDAVAVVDAEGLIHLVNRQFPVGISLSSLETEDGVLVSAAVLLRKVRLVLDGGS